MAVSRLKRVEEKLNERKEGLSKLFERLPAPDRAIGARIEEIEKALTIIDEVKEEE